jgi:Protein of unknown function (DUF3443)
MDVVVDGGPTGGGVANVLYATVTVCVPGTTSCTSIDHVLVDTGSVGLRLLASANVSALGLPAVNAASGGPLLSCERFLDGSFAWGPVKSADIKLGGMLAANVPVQLVADPAYPVANSPAGCSGKAISSSSAMGSNGILGIGLYQQDCGSSCDISGNPRLGYYYACNSVGCSSFSATTASLAKQLGNPVVALSPGYDNGYVLDLPAASTPVAPNTTVRGSLYFGVSSTGQTNNDGAGATALPLDNNGFFSTKLPGIAAKSVSFLDTGSNGLFYSDSSLTPVINGWYQPASEKLYPGVLLTGSSGPSLSLDFKVTGNTFFVNQYVYPYLAGDLSGSGSVALTSTIFDWGLPFFYGRRVFFGIEGKSVRVRGGLVSGPVYAF